MFRFRKICKRGKIVQRLCEFNIDQSLPQLFTFKLILGINFAVVTPHCANL